MIGLGVLIQRLSGNEDTVNTVRASLNKTIEKAWIDDNSLFLHFADGSVVELADEGQSCCEHRFMRTDDDLSELSGSKLLGFELKSTSRERDEFDVHEIQFLDIITSKGIFQLANHNIHNGYYGGFAVTIKQWGYMEPDPQKM